MTVYQGSYWAFEENYLPGVGDGGSDDSPDDRDDWDDARRKSYQDDVLDVFNLDDWVDPEPQYGDFWGQLDDEQEKI